VPIHTRPLSVTIVAWLFIVAGTVGFVYHAIEFMASAPWPADAIWVLAVRLLAIVGGVFTLRGANWARWLLVAWLAWHVAIGARHSTHDALAHGALLVVIAYLLLRPPASAYFRRVAPGSQRAAAPNGWD